MTDDQKNEFPAQEEPRKEPQGAPETEQTPQPQETPLQQEPPAEQPLEEREELSQEDAGEQTTPSEEEFSSPEEELPPQEETTQPAETPVPDVKEPEYPQGEQQAAVPPQQPQQPWQGYPPQGPWTGWGYPPYAQNPSPYGQPQQSWQGYPPVGQAVNPPRKKMSRGLKVFLWITSALVAGTVIGFSAFAISWAVAGPGWGQSLVETLPESPAESQSPTQEEEESAPQVEQPDVDVTPNTEGILIQEKPQGEPMDAQEVYDKVVKSTVAITASYDGESTDSSGTGIIATSDGYIITNSHVVLNTKNVLVTVTTYDGQQYDAVVVGTDRTTDLAVIKTNDHNFTPAEFGDASQLSIGEWVLAIGNPGGERFASSLTRGIISGLDRAVQNYSEEGMTFIQTDAAINPGNSGGPLVNMYGQVVGINSSKIITEGYEGMGFAIPVSKAKDILDQLLSGGYVEGRVRLGITGYDVTAAQASFYGLPRGFVIASIDEDSAFSGTDAQVDDIIVALDGEPVQELSDISNLLLRYSPGDQVTVTLYRIPTNGMGEGEEIEVTITLLEDKGETQR